MFIINNEDFNLFNKIAYTQFVKELFDFCEASFPKWFSLMNKDHVNTALMWCINRSNKLGFNERGSLYLFVNLNIICGGYFYKSIHFKESVKQIKENYYIIEKEKTKILYKNSVLYYENVLGKNLIFLKEAINRITEINLKKLNKQSFEIVLIDILKQAFPQKVNKMNYSNFIARNKKYAFSNYEITTNFSQTLYVLLAFF